MAAPVLTFVILPDDSANAGKKVQTQSEIISGQTVHAHYFVPRSKRKILGNYLFAMATQAIVLTAHNGTSTGFFWLQLPAASAVHLRLRRLQLAFSTTSTTAMLTAPRVALAKFTFTGTASGAEVNPMLRSSGDAAAVGHLRTAVTGMTVTVGNLGWSTIVPAVLTGVGAYGVPPAELRPSDEEDFVDIASGEGLLLYQPDAGTSGDTRVMSVSGAWDEFDSA